MFTDPLPGFLNGDMGILTKAETLLPSQISVAMLKEPTSVLADPKMQANTLGIGIFGFPAGTVGIMGRDGFDGSFGEGKTTALITHGDLLS